METVKLKGFAPDLDPMTPGIFADCNEIIPSPRGYEPLPGRELKLPALVGVCRGAMLSYDMSGLGRIVAGTPRHLWIQQTGGWESADRPSGYDEAVSTAEWRFCQYGNYTIAVNGVVEPQLLKTGEKKFSNLGGSPPKGTFVETAAYFLFMFAPPGAPNQWWCSGLGNPENWTTDLSSQSANGTLVQTPGAIVGARALGENIVVYKRHSIYIGQYVGPPYVWAFKATSTEAGAIGNEAIVAIADSHVFIGDQQFYILNGGGPPQKLETPLTNWFFTDELDRLYEEHVVGWWDRHRDIVFWHYPSKGNATPGTLDSWIAWNMRSNSWTRGKMNVEAVARVQTATAPALTYDEFGTILQRYDDANTLGYQDPKITGPKQTTVGIFLNDHAFYTLTGTPGTSYFVTSDMGDPSQYTMVRRIKPLFARYPTSPVSASLSLKENLGGTTRSGQMSSHNRDTGWINLRQTAKLHRMRLNFQGDFEMLSFSYDAVAQGTR